MGTRKSVEVKQYIAQRAGHIQTLRGLCEGRENTGSATIKEAYDK